MHKIPSLLCLLLFLIPTSSYSSATSYTGRVVDVADGDTVTILTQNQEQIQIRLAGIDCPEGSQVHGENAKEYISSLVSERRVRVIPETVDQYGRTVATLLINGENINRRIIAFGHGWVYRKYCTADYCNEWLKLEQTARDARLGLWSSDNPQPPWEWRAEQRSKNSDEGGFNKFVDSFLSVGGGGSSDLYHGNRRSHVFHGPSCKDYNCKNCTVMFGSAEEAVNAGYRAHRECVNE